MNKFICPKCGKISYSAADLDRLYDPYCDDCHVKIVYADEERRCKDGVGREIRSTRKICG